MEEVFRKEGLPTELTRLPFVESSFNLRARSKVGASGIWQFMRSTGRLYLKINDAVDERNDPIRATEAAAKLLKANYDSLKSWPLAVTAYNHGRKGMMRAVRRVGSDSLEDVVADYRSRSFGFASSNFYTELMAAIEVEKNAEKYFGKVERDQPLKYYEVEIPDYINVRELSRFLNLDTASLRDMNPALTHAVFSGNRLIPRGYRLRLPLNEKYTPDSEARVFLAGYEQIPQIFKLRRQAGPKYVRQ
jgi:membrane-bound lytic murein transglycosylase D